MFRASQIPSDEIYQSNPLWPHFLAILALGNVTTADLSKVDRESNQNTPLKDGNETRSCYGVTVILPPINYKYPVAVIFILLAKFFEAFAANGIRTILAIYLRDYLNFNENFSTIMLHIFNFFGQFCPIFGAILADSYLGTIRTISSFYLIYALGWILLILTSLPTVILPIIYLASVSLLLIAVGNGSIRACITSLGALQFKVPEQGRLLTEYFSLYYFVYYFGIFLSKLLPPLVRGKTKCFGEKDCYPAVFGTLGTSFLVSWMIYLIGKLFYKPEKRSKENVLIKFYGCIKNAVKIKWSRNSSEPRARYWLHNSVGRYDRTFVNDVAKVLKLSKLFLPLPIYFALLAQQDSSWTFQATMMNTTFGNINIEPDQAKAMGPIILFILIPIWQYICQPSIKVYFGKELKPLYSVSAGGVCSALSFVCAGVLQEYINNNPYQTISIIWQIPQFLLLMLGELLLSIPGLQFAFTEAPSSMKSVVTATWFLNNAFGNLLVVFITKVNLFDSQSTEYFFYAVLMLISIIIFSLLAYNYILHERISNFYTQIDTISPASRCSGQKSNKTEMINNMTIPAHSNETVHFSDMPSTSSSTAPGGCKNSI